MEKPITVGVELILERMKLFPDEFISDDDVEGSDWHFFLPVSSKEDLEDVAVHLSYPETYLPPEEVAMLKAGLRKLYSDAYTARVMEKLGQPKKGRRK